MLLHVAYNGTVIGNVNMPEIRVEEGEAEKNLTVSTNFVIVDTAMWILFVKDMINVGFFGNVKILTCSARHLRGRLKVCAR
jgi:hypothetical protein